MADKQVALLFHGKPGLPLLDGLKGPDDVLAPTAYTMSLDEKGLKKPLYAWKRPDAKAQRKRSATSSPVSFPAVDQVRIPTQCFVFFCWGGGAANTRRACRCLHLHEEGQ